MGTARRLVKMHCFALLWSLLGGLTLAACGPTQLMPTPNLYLGRGTEPFAAVPEELQRSSVDVLFATDRQPETDAGGKLSFGAGRSRSLAFGSCVVQIGDGLSWDELVAQSVRADRTVPLPMRLVSVTEAGRFPPTPWTLERDDAGVRIDPAIAAKIEAETATLHAELARRLALSPRKEVLVYVHGFNNTFEDATLRAAELSHFLGHEIVTIAYTWPAGAGGGFLRGYQRDAESAEFTVFHFKSFLKAVASCPDVARINLLAHSRGSALATTALRELFLESGGFAQAEAFRSRYRFHNAILAAADIDIEVVEQRMPAEQVGLGLDRVTIYISKTDKALGLSDWLFQGVARLGQLGDDTYAKLKDTLPNVSGVAVVDARIKGDFLGHGYFQSDPAVSSDLISVLRFDRDPGAEHGRPLSPVVGNYWAIDDRYLLPAKSPDSGSTSPAAR